MINEHVEEHVDATVGGPTVATTMVVSTVPKEKRGWFASLTRRKKSQSQTSLANAATTPTADALPSPTTLQNNNNNNDNEPSVPLASSTVSTTNYENATADGTTCHKRKEEKNVFQRFRKKLGVRLNALRKRQHEDDELATNNGTTDATAEFLTHSPVRAAPLSFRFMRAGNQNSCLLDETEMVPFTHDYKRFIVKKWLQRESGPNRVMYKACCEMLSQVWYWGEISRRDAQKQLTDKPTGSFLVRDSETSGCQFTLSFRIVNVTLHYRLEYRDHYWHFEELQYESIVEMIEDILYRCTNDNFVCFVKVPNEMQPPFPVILKYPLSRYLKMPHLQDLCRRVIQRHAANDEIAKLPIPPKLLEYLGEPRELVFSN